MSSISAFDYPLKNTASGPSETEDKYTHAVDVVEIDEQEAYSSQNSPDSVDDLWNKVLNNN